MREVAQSSHTAVTSVAETLSMDVEEIVELSRDVARRIDSRLMVEGVTSADGGTGRIELLVTIEGCHTDPCALVLNVERGDRLSMRTEVEAKLTDAIGGHLTQRP